MTVYIALLRGINVGGNNKIKMADLRKACEAIGLRRVQTYIQSGNVLFETEESAEELLRSRLEQMIEEKFGIKLYVVLRTSDELRQIVAGFPYSEEKIAEADAASDAVSEYVAMLLEAPGPEQDAALSPYSNEAEQYRIIGREIYLLVHQSIADSKLATQLMKLKVPATVRNRNTMNKLVALADAMEEA
jgi:uncharacterized protein (DUF1697 family)